MKNSTIEAITSKTTTAAIAVLTAIAIITIAGSARADDGSENGDGGGGASAGGCDPYVHGALQCSEQKYGVEGVTFVDGPYIDGTHTAPLDTREDS